jgi:alanine racemase
MLTINLDGIKQNYLKLKSEAKNVAGIVKANAYGLGVKEITSVLESESCPCYFVATLEEGISLRELTVRPIYILNGFHDPKTKPEYIEFQLTPVLNSLSEINHWPGKKVIHIDTGMNRLGLIQEEIDLLLKNSDQIENIEMIMSHFSSADEKDSPLTKEQYEKFLKYSKHFPNAKKSLANSAGIFESSDYHFDLVRPGMALYGLNPTPYKENPMSATISLEVPLLKTKKVKQGEPIGYGATYRCKKDTIVGTIALGYADGFLRSLSNNGNVYYKNYPCPIIGRVSMDLVTIDLGEHQCSAGEMIEIIGKNQSADDLATNAETIGYEILTSLGTRYPRNYIH